MPDLLRAIRALIRWLTDATPRCRSCGQRRRIDGHHVCQWPGLRCGSLVYPNRYEAPEWCPRRRDAR